MKILDYAKSKVEWVKGDCLNNREYMRGLTEVKEEYVEEEFYNNIAAFAWVNGFCMLQDSSFEELLRLKDEIDIDAQIEMLEKLRDYNDI